MSWKLLCADKDLSMFTHLLRRFSYERYIISGLTLALVAIALGSPGDTALAHDTASRQYSTAWISSTNAYKGGLTNIKTADPPVDFGGFSAEVLWVGDEITTPRRLAEVGWRTRPSPNDAPKWYWGYYDKFTTWDMDWVTSSSPTVGTTYLYDIVHDTGTDWDLNINGSTVQTVDLDMSAADYVVAGGEVTSFLPDPDNNAMGPSTVSTLMYKNTSGTWTFWGTWTDDHVDTGRGYSMTVVSTTKFDNAGNN